MLVNPGRSIFTANQEGQTLPVGQPEKAVIRGDLFMSRRTAADQRVLAVHLPNGSSLLISKSLAPTDAVMTKLRWVLLIVGGVGMAVAAVAGGMVTQAGLRPVGRLTEAAERVARTDDLRPIPVFGSDELARLTEAFNMMLRALAESRERQTRLVADAGHELRTPLTSLRTNIELLMASSAPGAPPLPEQEMVDLRTDVIAQIEELSTLVGDLVDLTRDDAGEVVHEPVDMSEVIDRSLERVRRRRNDVEFDVDVTPWQVYGDSAGLSRAVLNLMDNAAKWSPSGEHVGVRLRQLNATHAELVVSDHGPGIPRARARTGVRAVLPLDHGAGDARLGPWAWRSSNRWCSNTAGRFASKTPFRAVSRRARRFTSCCPDSRCRPRSTRPMMKMRRMLPARQLRGTLQRPANVISVESQTTQAR